MHYIREDSRKVYQNKMISEERIQKVPIIDHLILQNILI